MKKISSKINLNVLIIPLYFVLALWLVFWLEIRLDKSYSHYGILPGVKTGMKGILFGPFIHGSLQHLFNNSIPLLVLGAALLYFYPKQAFKVFILGYLFSGLGTWFIGRYAFHIGASGVVYMLASYLFFQGLFSKNRAQISLSLVVVFFYGSMIWYLFPIDPQVSWEGHSSGFIVGFLLALLFYKSSAPATKVYAWEKEDYDPSTDDFMQHFDSSGNFHPTSYWYNKENQELSHSGEDEYKSINYEYTTNKKE